MKKDVTIVDYRPEYRHYFERFNREWLEKYFSVEPIDEKYFSDPEGEILEKGGEIFFAHWKGEILGTASLVWEGDQLELAKMGVTPSAQGLGLGEMLVREADNGVSRPVVLVASSNRHG